MIETPTFQQAALLDLIAEINDNPTTFTWKSRDHVCLASRIALESPLADGGFEDRPVFDFVTTLLDEDAAGDLVSRFPDDDAPGPNDTIKIHGSDYRLRDVEREQWDEDLQQYTMLRATLWGAEVLE